MRQEPDYQQLDQLPYLSTGVTTWQQSSFDRTGGNADYNHVLQTAADGTVIAQHQGPGSTTALWHGYQAAEISVDGTAPGQWPQPLASPYHRWLDDQYATAGRSSISVTLTPVAGSPPWSAASYRIVSLTP